MIVEVPIDGGGIGVPIYDGAPDGTFWSPPRAITYVQCREVVEVMPDVSRLNRADRRAVIAIAKRYGWKINR